MKIYDCFTFFNELDLLALRLVRLDKIVERFILVEATETFQGTPKPLYFAENMELFTRWLHKITHIVVKFNGLDDTWEREFHQRNSISLGLPPTNDGWVIISDADEIPEPDAVRRYSGEGISTLLMDLFYYDETTRCRFTWDLAKITTLEEVHRRSPEQIRHASRTDIIEKAGQHYSFFGSPQAIQDKIKAFAHAEYNTPEFTDLAHIEACIKNGVDLFGREGVKFDHIIPLASLGEQYHRKITNDT